MSIIECSVDGCERKSQVKGFCRSHYRRWRLYGDPIGSRPKGKRPRESRQCSIDGCHRKFVCKELCSTHYAQLRAHGDPLHRPPDANERYSAGYERRSETECWPWIKGKDKDGYGKFSPRKGCTDRSHRFGWELFNQMAIPLGMQVCHTCDNPACQNPSHLFLGTHQDNMTDKVRKGRLVANPYRDKGGRFTEKPL